MFNVAGVTLTSEDFLLAALWAFFITMLVSGISKFVKALKAPMEFTYPSGESSDVLKKCDEMFPKEMFMFKGQTVKRGMSVRVTTLKKKVFEGKLVGCNSDNVMCVVTQKYVIAQGLDDIEEISVIE